MEDHPGFATDLLFDRYQGEVTDHDAFWDRAHPGSPDYYGNYLLLPTPAIVTKGWLEASFDRLIGWDPRIRHRTFQWPRRRPETAGSPGFVAAGYQYMECVVLALGAMEWQAPHRQRPGSGSPVHRGRLGSVARLRAGRAGSPPIRRERYLPYLLSRRQLYQAMIDDGLGQWWGLWHQDQLVASCGLFFTGTLGRFPLVRTHAEWRNRGLCRLLLSQVARQGLARASSLIIVADEHYHAQRVYRTLGFVPVARIGPVPLATGMTGHHADEEREAKASRSSWCHRGCAPPVRWRAPPPLRQGRRWSDGSGHRY